MIFRSNGHIARMYILNHISSPKRKEMLGAVTFKQWPNKVTIK